MKRAILTLTVLCILGLIAGIYFLMNPPKTSFREKGQDPPTTNSKKSLSDFPQPSSALLEAKPKSPPLSPIVFVSPDFAVDDMAQTHGSADIPVPNGARVPAVLLDRGGPVDSPETAAIMNTIIEDFAAKIEEAKRANRNEEVAWEEAREMADDQYKQFFGFEAFNEATLEAAGEAYEESSRQNPIPAR